MKYHIKNKISKKELKEQRKKPLPLMNYLWKEYGAYQCKKCNEIHIGIKGDHTCISVNPAYPTNNTK